jgi:hypothetical protein
MADNDTRAIRPTGPADLALPLALVHDLLRTGADSTAATAGTKDRTTAGGGPGPAWPAPTKKRAARRHRRTAVRG